MSDLTEAFEKMRQVTYCPFARGASVVVGSPCVVSDDGVDLGSVPDELERFLAFFRVEHHDGFVWPVLGDCFDTVQGAASLFARTLAALRSVDPSPPFRSWDAIETREWQFSFCGEPLFLNMFGNCYQVEHSKHLATGGGIVVFAQPEDAFDFCGVDPSRRGLKDEIRRRFAEAGMSYDGAMIDGRIEAQLYVFPERIGDPPVRWWDHADTRPHLKPS